MRDHIGYLHSMIVTMMHDVGIRVTRWWLHNVDFILLLVLPLIDRNTMTNDHEDTQLLEIDIEADHQELITVDESETVVADEQKKKDGAAAPATREREAGKSILPFSRVQRIIKVDKKHVDVGSSDGCTGRDCPDIASYGGVHQKVGRGESEGRREREAVDSAA